MITFHERTIAAPGGTNLADIARKWLAGAGISGS
jgi:hypothetical protein